MWKLYEQMFGRKKPKEPPGTGSWRKESKANYDIYMNFYIWVSNVISVYNNYEAKERDWNNQML